MEQGYDHMENKTCKIRQKDVFLSSFLSLLMDGVPLEVKK